MITLYDIPTTTAIKATSGNVWKARFSLNYKGLPFKTEWIEIPDIESAVYRKHNLSAPTTRPDGSPKYTLPVIYDSSTDKAIADSFEIAKYLDATYPDTPKVFPDTKDGAEAGWNKQEVMINTIMGHIFPIFPYYCRELLEKANPPTREYLNVVVAKDLAAFLKVQKIDELNYTPEQNAEGVEKLKEALGHLDEKFGGKGEFGWFLGDKISFADFELGGLLLAMKNVWPGAEVWDTQISKWHGGKWANFVSKLEPYTTVN
ncbi:hypothetical protein CC1G_05417 [Coprinopsis cinerea okayama7|uniref:GST N-terminal domain-containing protein n=1 Tax=Coprinopsis cinerea (strain Okayama-7 / 130 / ATCC MYA-4618 / FGSC 9003) TaxID=240176 RepID=A8NQ15_COPC7|nr:hypothetical protein CC1G_05417 [Coprinopsis cinerea okayama7\|eukprot:XP_001835455.1 hypothetical protein CC1G_05417 [Coprinopsis cinerea okayama7\